MQNSVLLIDSDVKALAVMETALRYFYVGKIQFSQSAEEAIHVLKNNIHPELILVDYDLLTSSTPLMNFLKEKELYVPIVTTSRAKLTRLEAARNFSLITGVVNKPLDPKEFSSTVQSYTSISQVSPAFVPISFQTLLNLPIVNVDIFISLSETNFIRVTKKEDLFTREDAEKLQKKGFKEVYIRASSCFELLNSITANMEELANKEPKEEYTLIAMESIENLERMSRFFGWTPELVESTIKTIQSTIKVFSKNEAIIKTLNAKFSEKESHYTRHVSLLSFLSCILGNHFDWIGEGEKTKLILAALLHDYSLDPRIYHIMKTDFEKVNLHNKAEEIERYRKHPMESSKAVKALDSFSSDVELIVMQHHERPDGSGFPRSLTASRISHLSTLFIILEDLVDFLGDGNYIEMSVEGFCTHGKEKYTQGNFKKFFEIIERELSSKLARA